MYPAAFEYHSPSSVKDALGLLGQHGDDAKLLAGGHSLIPMMKLRLAKPEHLVDLQDLSELRAMREEGGSLVLGALVTQKQIIAAELLARKCPILAETARQIADPQVRHLNMAQSVAKKDKSKMRLVAHSDASKKDPSFGRKAGARCSKDCREWGLYFVRSDG